MTLTPGVSPLSVPPQTSMLSSSQLQGTTARTVEATVEVNDWLLDADDTVQMVFYKDKMTCESRVCLNRDVISCEYMGQKRKQGFRCFTNYAPYGFGLSAVRINCLERGENEHPDCRLFYSLAPMSDTRYEQLAGEIFIFLCIVALCCCVLLSMDPIYDRSLYYGYGRPFCYGCNGLPPPAAFVPYRINMNDLRSGSCVFKHAAGSGREPPPTAPTARRALSSRMARLATAAGFRQNQHHRQAKPAIGLGEKVPV